MVTLTAEEHHARAMLLDMVYREWANIYVHEGKPSLEWLDADTLEVISDKEKAERIRQSLRGTWNGALT